MPEERIKWYLVNEGVDYWLNKHYDADKTDLPEPVRQACEKAILALIALDKTLVKHNLLPEENAR